MDVSLDFIPPIGLPDERLCLVCLMLPAKEKTDRQMMMTVTLHILFSMAAISFILIFMEHPPPI
jgi:hypothetical protein